MPLRWLTIKGEAAALTTTSQTADDVVQYVIQVERQSGELSLVAGYAGEVVTNRRAVGSRPKMDSASCHSTSLTKTFKVLSTPEGVGAET